MLYFNMQFKLDNGDLISLTLIRKPRMKHIYLRVTPDGVVVSANRRAKLSDIEAFVYSKSAWLRKHLGVQKVQNEKRQIVSGNRVYYRGEATLLECNEVEKIKKATLERLEDRFLLSMPKDTTQEERGLLFDAFYKKEAIHQILPMVDRWSKIMGLKPKDIGFRRAKRRWGSCSSQNSLSFNYYLMKLPLPMVEYVVVHELAHIEEKNHSADFWALVESHLPNYKVLVKELRAFERLL